MLVVWPDVDLRFKNTTPYGVLVSASIELSFATAGDVTLDVPAGRTTRAVSAAGSVT